MGKRKSAGEEGRSTPKVWKEEEIRSLIRVWSDEDIQYQLKHGNNSTKQRAWDTIIRRMNDVEYVSCTKIQCKNKIGKLRLEYESIDKRPVGSQRAEMPFWDLLHPVLCSYQSSAHSAVQDGQPEESDGINNAIRLEEVEPDRDVSSSEASSDTFNHPDPPKGELGNQLLGWSRLSTCVHCIAGKRPRVDTMTAGNSLPKPPKFTLGRQRHLYQKLGYRRQKEGDIDKLIKVRTP